MQIYNVGYPFKQIALDIAGSFPETERGKCYVLDVGDYFQ